MNQYEEVEIDGVRMIAAKDKRVLQYVLAFVVIGSITGIAFAMLAIQNGWMQ